MSFLILIYNPISRVFKGAAGIHQVFYAPLQYKEKPVLNRDYFICCYWYSTALSFSTSSPLLT